MKLLIILVFISFIFYYLTKKQSIKQTKKQTITQKKSTLPAWVKDSTSYQVWKKMKLAKNDPELQKEIKNHFWEQARSALEKGELDNAIQIAFNIKKLDSEWKGYEFNEKSTLGNPLFIEKYLKSMDSLKLPITDDSPENKKKIKTEMMLAMLKGENPVNTERRLREVISDFQWPEFDAWLERFREKGEWPPLWEDISWYYYLKEEAEMSELLNELTKKELIELAEQINHRIKMSIKKKEMIEVLLHAESLSREKVFSFIKNKYIPKVLRNKRMLLIHTNEFESTSMTRLEDLKDANEKFYEISGTTDSCSWCKQYFGKKFSIKDNDESAIPPIHPGCRCVIVPVVD